MTSESKMPSNQGSFRPIDVIASKGSIFNPNFPAAAEARFSQINRVIDLIYKALAPVLPNDIIAGSIQPGRCVPILASAASMNASSDRCDRSMSRSSPRRVSPSASSLPDAKVSSASQPSPVAKSTFALFAA